MDDRLEMELLRGQERKGLAQIEARLCPENRERASAGAIALGLPVLEHEPEQVEISPHPLNKLNDAPLRRLAVAGGFPKAHAAGENVAVMPELDAFREVFLE